MKREERLEAVLIGIRAGLDEAKTFPETIAVIDAALEHRPNDDISQGGVTVTHLAHNQKIEGSTPSPAIHRVPEQSSDNMSPEALIEELPDSCLPPDKALAQLGFEKVAPEWPSVKEQQEYWDSLPQYECPSCGTWHPVSPKQDEVNCLCGKLRVSVDADFSDGSWHDRTRLVRA